MSATKKKPVTDGDGLVTDQPLDGMPATGEAIEDIPVHVSYEIIRLFSEGLYQSPHKAVEELVSNGYDAGVVARSVPGLRNILARRAGLRGSVLLAVLAAVAV